MHLFISYTLEELKLFQKPALNKKVLSVINSFENVHIFENTYVVKVENQSEWNSILTRLTGVAEMCGCGFKFIMGPANIGGTYNGWLKSDQWPQLKKITSTK